MSSKQEISKRLGELFGQNLEEMAGQLPAQGSQIINKQTTRFRQTKGQPKDVYSIKVLFSVVEGSSQKFYVGGDGSPRFIYEIPATAFVRDASLTNTGRGTSDWLAGISYSFSDAEGDTFVYLTPATTEVYRTSAAEGNFYNRLQPRGVAWSTNVFESMAAPYPIGSIPQNNQFQSFSASVDTYQAGVYYYLTTQFGSIPADATAAQAMEIMNPLFSMNFEQYTGDTTGLDPGTSYYVERKGILNYTPANFRTTNWRGTVEAQWHATQVGGDPPPGFPNGTGAGGFYPIHIYGVYDDGDVFQGFAYDNEYALSTFRATGITQTHFIAKGVANKAQFAVTGMAGGTELENGVSWFSAADCVGSSYVLPNLTRPLLWSKVGFLGFESPFKRYEIEADQPLIVGLGLKTALVARVRGSRLETIRDAVSFINEEGQEVTLDLSGISGSGKGIDALRPDRFGFGFIPTHASTLIDKTHYWVDLDRLELQGSDHDAYSARLTQWREGGSSIKVSVFIDKIDGQQISRSTKTNQKILGLRIPQNSVSRVYAASYYPA